MQVYRESTWANYGHGVVVPHAVLADPHTFEQRLGPEGATPQDVHEAAAKFDACRQADVSALMNATTTSVKLFCGYHIQTLVPVSLRGGNFYAQHTGMVFDLPETLAGRQVLPVLSLGAMTRMCPRCQTKTCLNPFCCKYLNCACTTATEMLRRYEKQLEAAAPNGEEADGIQQRIREVHELEMRRRSGWADNIRSAGKRTKSAS